MRLFSLSLAFVVAISGCRKPTATPTHSPAPTTLLPGTFINSPGSWWARHASGSFRLEVNPTKDGLEYRYGIFDQPEPPAGKSGSGGASPIQFPSWPPDWFIYAEDTDNPKTLWFYGSSRRLWYIIIKDKNYDAPAHEVIDQNGNCVKGSRNPPYEVVLRLPADLQKRFPAVQAPVGRPAF